MNAKMLAQFLHLARASDNKKTIECRLSAKIVDALRGIFNSLFSDAENKTSHDQENRFLCHRFDFCQRCREWAHCYAREQAELVTNRNMKTLVFVRHRFQGGLLDKAINTAPGACWKVLSRISDRWLSDDDEVRRKGHCRPQATLLSRRTIRWRWEIILRKGLSSSSSLTVLVVMN